MKRRNENAPYWEMRRHADRQICEWALQMTDGNVTAAAELLGVNKQFLYRKIHELGIDHQRFRGPKYTNKPKKPFRESAPEAEA